MLRKPFKPLVWLGSSLDDLRSFSADAQDVLGRALHRVQLGLAPSDWKPMSSIGAGVSEIRAHVRGEYRVIYVARFAEAIYVLHSFQKKTRKTSQRDLEIAKARLAIAESLPRVN
jgi:phage-related protein